MYLSACFAHLSHCLHYRPGNLMSMGVARSDQEEQRILMNLQAVELVKSMTTIPDQARPALNRDTCPD